MTRQLHIRLPKTLFVWIESKALASDRSRNYFIVQKLSFLKQEEENATREIKSLQSLNQPQD